MVFDPDLLGEGVNIERGSNILNQIFNLFARYVQKVHLDEFICKCLRYAAGRNFQDVIGPGDIACIVSIIKNSKDMWNQDLRMQELGTQAIGNQEKILKPLFTSGSGQKRTQGKSLRNLEGMKFFIERKQNGGRFMIVRRIRECFTIGGRDGYNYGIRHKNWR
jgi:hypothetical protein